MSALQGAMAALIGVFHEHAGGNRTLDKKELAALLKKEFEGLASNNPEAVDQIFTGLDMDGSGSVDFTEFVTMVAALTAATNEMLCEKPT
ncbi:protein S100-A1-like [Boleophthalmus pectinirostris]|uniref:protein S100-A1-like n=1 Tax=Boleophthalmus pectinirostris TaxID=150288 RepID=UPI002432527F|nr:protein S100-A1-like [Boleophthalmus pectinirostris]